jgi:WD40 repeat protein
VIRNLHFPGKFTSLCTLICCLFVGSADRTVKFWDLETFELIGSAGPEVILCLKRYLLSSTWEHKSFLVLFLMRECFLWNLSPFRRLECVV